jgi:hypothetical protein
VPRKQTPYGVIDVDENGTIIDTPDTRAALERARAANPEASRGGYEGSEVMPSVDEVVQSAQDAGNTDYTPGYDPDYEALIQGDSIFQQTRGDLAAQGIADAAQRKANVNRALINFGEVPDLAESIRGLGLDPNSPMFKMLFADVDQTTRRGAQDMTDAGFSTTAQLGKVHSANMEDLLSKLAARGSVRSGATGVGTGLEGERYGAAQFDARRNLLDYLTGLQSAFSDAERGRQGQLTTALTDATGRQIAQHPATSATGTKPTGTSGTLGLPPPPPVPSGDPPPSPTASVPQATTQATANSIFKRLNLPE